MSIKQWHNEVIGERVVKALLTNGFHALYLAAKEQAVEYVLSLVEPGTRVGFGGSATIKQLGLGQAVKEKGGVVLDHGQPGLTPEERIEIMRQEVVSDLFLCSANAITLDGYLVNVDGNGNRVAAMTFGPKKVIGVAGVNKVCTNTDTAFDRIRTAVAPMNNKRLQLDNPCVKTGTCMDCDSKNRICRIYSVIKRKPRSSDFTVLLIGEELGF